MSEIAGRMSIQEGAKYLERPFGGRGVLLGGVTGVKRGNVLILGAGNVGLNAAKMAVGLNANVTITDVNLTRLAYIDDLFGSKITTLYSSDANIREALKDADLVIGSVVEVQMDDSGAASYAILEPKVDFDSLTEVFIIKSFDIVT